MQEDPFAPPKAKEDPFAPSVATKPDPFAPPQSIGRGALDENAKIFQDAIANGKPTDLIGWRQSPRDIDLISAQNTHPDRLFSLRNTGSLPTAAQPFKIEIGQEGFPDFFAGRPSVGNQRVLDVSSEPAYNNPYTVGDARRDIVRMALKKRLDELSEKGRLAYEKALAERPISTRAQSYMGSALEGLGVPRANQLEIMKSSADGKIGEALGKSLRNSVNWLPFVTPPEASQEAQVASYVDAAGKGQTLDKSLPDRIAGDSLHLAGFLAQFGGLKAPVSAASKAIGGKLTSDSARVILGAKEGRGALGLAEGIVPSAGTMGFMSAEQPLMQGKLGDAAIEFTKGAALDAALRPIGGMGASLPNQYLRGKVPESVLARLRPISGGAMQGAALTAWSPEDATLDQLISNVATMGAAGAFSGGRKQLPGVDAAAREQAIKSVKETPPTPEQIAKASGKPETTLELKGDPAFTKLVMGDRSTYLLPKADSEILPTAAEYAFRANEPTPAMLSKAGIEKMAVPTGDFFFKRKPLEQRFLQDPMGRNQFAVFKLGEPIKDKKTDAELPNWQLDLEASVKKVVAAGKEGWLYNYGEGNESKDGATHMVTGRDRYGREIVSILAKNVDSASKALKDYHGATNVEVRPISRGLEVLRDRIPYRQATNELLAQQSTQDPAIKVSAKPYDIAPNTGDEALTKEQLSERARNMVTPTSLDPTFSGLSQESPDLVTAMRRDRGAFQAGEQYGKMAAGQLETAVNNPKLLNLFMRDVVDAQAEGGVAQGRVVPEALFAQAGTKAMIDANRAQFAPLSEVMSGFVGQLKPLYKAGGVNADRPLREGSEYTSMVPVDLNVIEVPGGIRIESEQVKALRKAHKDNGETWMVGDPEVIDAIQNGGVIPPGTKAYDKIVGYARLLRTPQAQQAGAAKFATFQSPVYSILPGDVLPRMARDAIQSSARNELVAALHGEAARVPRKMVDVEDPITGEVKKEDAGPMEAVQYNGQTVRTRSTDIGEIPSWMDSVLSPEVAKEIREYNQNERVTVPEPVAIAYENLRGLDPRKMPGILAQTNNALAAADAALTTADGPKTGLRLMHTWSTIAGATGNSKAGRLIAAIGGPLRFVKASMNLMNITDAKFSNDFMTLLREGVIDMRSIGDADRPSKFADRIQDWVPGAPYVQSAMFGPTGVANRVKVGAYRLFRDAGMNHAQAVDETIRLTGITLRDLQPQIVRAFGTFGLDKYPSAHYQALTSGLRSLGIGPEGSTDKRIMTGTIANLVLSTVLANWAATDDDEREGTADPGRVLGMPRGLRLGYFSHNGEEIPLFKTTDPNTERLFRVFGLSPVFEAGAAGTLTFDNALELMTKGIFSQQLNRSAATLKPLTDAGWIQKFSRRGNEITPEMSMTDRLLGHVPGLGSLQGEVGDNLDPRRKLADRITAGLLKGMYGGPNIKSQRDIQVQVGAMAAQDHLQSDANMQVAMKIRRANLDPGKWYEVTLKELGVDPKNATVEQWERVQDVLGKLKGMDRNTMERTVRVLMERDK